MKIKTAAIIMLFCILFSSCTVQTEFDVCDFCERYNKLSGEKILSTSDFLSDNDGFLYCFLTAGESRVLITLDVNENSSLDGIFLTAEKDSYSENDRDAILNCVFLAFGAFNYADREAGNEKTASVGFDSDFEPFCDCYKSEEDGKYRITLYSNEHSFTVSQEKIDSD